ncbi:hypothetical protein DHEL01_v208431 [Diaporthe helianthi]|uniref:Uncharacterized protein n=1 Tax=Diaporthe helianthi TaxID=158607 RepID=A0A2P5HSD8_DIAHE|nr:hypothetical protein DHEL01_v208431 [Diaporthe helianthi]
MFNVSRAFRTAEAQRLLPILRQQFGDEAMRHAANQPASHFATENRQADQKTLLYNFEPPSHEAAVVMDRKIGETIRNLQRSRNSRAHPFDQGNELGRVQWSAINIIVSLGSVNNTQRTNVRSMRLSDPEFWKSYHDMIQHFSQSEKRTDELKRDLNAISNAIANRMEDLRQTFHDLHVEERDTFHTIVEDLLPITKYVTTEELDQNLPHPPARCTVCNLPFSTAVREPATPVLGNFPAAQAREQQVHNPVGYEQCAFVPQKHAFCLREFGRLLMNKDVQTRKVVGAKAKTNWRCTTCCVDPWRKHFT